MCHFTRFFLATLFLFSLSAATAQPGRQQGTPEEIAERQTAQMTENLGLNEEQAVLVREINLANAIKVKQAREKNQGNPEQMRAAMMALRAERNEHLKAVLTKKQFRKLEAMQAQQMEERRGQQGQH